MTARPREYWATYERKSPHISGQHVSPRAKIRCDWTLIDNAAAALEFPNGSALVNELARLLATDPRAFSALVERIIAGNFEWGGPTQRNVSSKHWDTPGVLEGVRAALYRISYGDGYKAE